MSSLIKSLSLKNFKGFSEEVRIELRPITLLFGANSAGKSSVLQALQYVREILERQNLNADRTLQGGEAVDLGGFLNLVNGRDPQKQVEIAIEMELGDNSIPELVPEAFDDWHTNSEDVWDVYDTLQGVRRAVQSVEIRLRIGWSEIREQPIVEGYEVAANGIWCLKVSASKDGRDIQMRINHANPIFLFEQRDASTTFELLEILDGQDFVNLEDLSKDARDAEALAKEVDPKRYSVLPALLTRVKEAGMERPGEGMRSWLADFRGALPKLDAMLNIPAPGAKGAEDIYVAREFTAFLSWLTVGPAVLLRDQLRQMRYIGPLRRIPKRGFEVSLTKSDSAWSDGLAAWETLITGSQDLVERVSDWMQSPAKLGTGYGIARKAYQEFDPNHPVPQPIGPIRKRAQLVDGAGLTLQPQDVGVGISQVLPVVVAAQDGSASVVCIEQPELHIHPAVQVGLGDLFIDGAVNQGLSFLIETHSEHLILRLLRRIREAAELTSKVIDQPLSPALIGVYCLSKRNGAVTIDEIPVTKEGDFAKPWPQGFFDERGAELF